MTFEKLPAVPGRAAYLNCGTPHDTLAMDALIGVGFGSAGWSRDGETLWQEQGQEEMEELPTVKDVEYAAAADPDHDWRIFYFAPLYEAEYQRQGDAHWVLVKRGEGFA